MAKNRYNETPKAQINYAPKKKEEEIILNFKPCYTCDKEITQGYYAHHDSGGVCSKICEVTFVRNKPSLIDFLLTENSI